MMNMNCIIGDILSIQTMFKGISLEGRIFNYAISFSVFKKIIIYNKRINIWDKWTFQMDWENPSQYLCHADTLHLRP